MVNDSSCVSLPRRAWPVAARAAVALAAAAVLALLAAACGGSTGGQVAQLGSTTIPSSTTPSAAAAQQIALLAFAACMRTNGVANFPDPNSSGVLPKRQIAQLAAGSPQFVPAHRACEHLLPNSGPTQAQVQEAWSDMRSFAHCMRAHGVQNWPDPTVTSPQDNRPFFNLPTNVDPDAPEIASEIRACQHVMHANNPLVTTQ
jgi:hypothetical protein